MLSYKEILKDIIDCCSEHLHGRRFKQMSMSMVRSCLLQFIKEAYFIHTTSWLDDRYQSFITRNRCDRWGCQQLATMLSNVQTTVTISAGVWWCLVSTATSSRQTSSLTLFINYLQRKMPSRFEVKSDSNNSNRSGWGTAKVFWWQDPLEGPLLLIEFL